MSRYEDTHLDDGMRHNGLVPSRAELAEEKREQAYRKRIEQLTRERDEAREQLKDLENDFRFLWRRYGSLRAYIREVGHKPGCASDRMVTIGHEHTQHKAQGLCDCGWAELVGD